jgi:hypothetical protein
LIWLTPAASLTSAGRAAASGASAGGAFEAGRYSKMARISVMCSSVKLYDPPILRYGIFPSRACCRSHEGLQLPPMMAAA